MKKTFTRTLGAAIIAATFFLLNFHASSCTGGGSTDSSGNRGGTPKYIITTTSPIYAGSQLFLECGSPNCQIALKDSSAKSIAIGTVPFDIPEKTELLISFGPKVDSPIISRGEPRK